MRYFISLLGVIFLLIYGAGIVYEDDLKLGTYIGYTNGKLFIETKNISKLDALSNCKINHKNNPSINIKCTWTRNFSLISQEIFKD